VSGIEVSGIELSDHGVSAELARIVARPMLVFSPQVRFHLAPGDRTFVSTGDRVVPGMPIAERTLDPELVDAGRVGGGENVRSRSSARSDAPASADDSIARDQADRDPPPIADGVSARRLVATSRSERRRPPEPGKWWMGGGERRGKPPKSKNPVRVGGTLLFESGGRWRVAAGERHEVVESPVTGVVVEARNSVGVTIEVAGAAMPGALAAGEPSRGYLDVPRLSDGELWASALDVGRSGAIVVAGSRLSGQAISRARAMSIRGLIAGSVGEGELRDLEASELRQRASLAPSVPFALIALDGHGRRPIATPILALLAALSGREVAIVTDPPLLVFDAAEVPLPELPPDWIRARSGPHAGREGRWLRSAGMYRFRSGIHLEGAVVRFVDDADPTTVPVADLERFVF
jgi:hypothetical protein